MFVIIGILAVFGAVLGGYLMEHGNIQVLLQPAELLIIGGAAAGTIFIANPPSILKGILDGLKGVFGGTKFGKAVYQDVLKQMYAIMQAARKKGLTELETDVDNPDKSELFSKWDQHLRDFVCDTLRMAMTGGPTPFELDQMMEVDMEVHHHYAHAARERAEYGGGLAARVRDRRGGAGRCDHDGRAGRASRGDRPQGGGRAGGNIPRNPLVLRFARPHGF